MSYFKKALEQISKIHEAKAQDYTKESEFENFEHSAEAAGITVLQAIDVLVATKQARIISLRGRQAKNEPILDTYLDRAVYSIIAYARLLSEYDVEVVDHKVKIDYARMLHDQGSNKVISNPVEIPTCKTCHHARGQHRGFSMIGWNIECLCCTSGHYEGEESKASQ